MVYLFRQRKPLFDREYLRYFADVWWTRSQGNHVRHLHGPPRPNALKTKVEITLLATEVTKPVVNSAALNVQLVA